MTEHRIERLWRDLDLPEYFLGNGGTNTKLYALHDALVERCAVAAEEKCATGREWVSGSLWANILGRAGTNVRKLKTGRTSPRSIELGDLVEVRRGTEYAEEWRGITMKVVGLRIDPQGHRWADVIEGKPFHRGFGIYDGETTGFDIDHLSHATSPTVIRDTRECGAT